MSDIVIYLLHDDHANAVGIVFIDNTNRHAGYCDDDTLIKTMLSIAHRKLILLYEDEDER